MLLSAASDCYHLCKGGAWMTQWVRHKTNKASVSLLQKNTSLYTPSTTSRPLERSINLCIRRPSDDCSHVFQVTSRAIHSRVYPNKPEPTVLFHTILQTSI
jgi:hypothetical protein